MRRLFLLFSLFLALLIPAESVAGPFMVMPKRGSAWSGGGSAVIDVDGDAENAGWKWAEYFAPGWGRIRLGKPDANFTHAFIRFPECPVPQGKTITKANLKTYVHSHDGATATISLKIYFNDVDDASVPDDGAAMDALVRTTAFLDTSIQIVQSQYTVNEFDVSSPLQEIVNRAGYVAANAVQIIIETYYSTTSYKSIDLYITDATYYAVLELEWE